MQNKQKTNPIMFLNLPIDSSKKDVIGLGAYANNLSAAIDGGAQTIAVTSAFGMGKTSIVELLKEKRSKCKNERILKVPMWMQLNNAEGPNEAINLHKNFLYQISNQLSHRRGTYVSRRLSPNYRLIKLHTNKPGYWIIILLALIFFTIAWVSGSFHDQIIKALPSLTDKIDIISVGAGIAALIMGIFSILGSEIILSSGKAEGERQIESDEIIELYYSEILKPRILSQCFSEFFLTKNFYKHYIIIIEDLDRSSNSDAVKSFLKEIRKYYIPTTSNSNYKYRNRVTFIVNIKPESELNKLCTENEPERIYDKLFDYVLNVQTINIDDYDTILNSFLEEKKAEISTFGLNTDGNLSSLPGMQWIIREPSVGMRTIKERLNRAFSLYESLQERFPSGNIAFEKCAVVAYITTAFESAFNETEDSAFQRIVEWSLKVRTSNTETVDDYKSFLPEGYDEYASVILDLVNSGIIDTNYRMYFYNYPKNSRIYTIAETVTQKAILYGNRSDNLNQSVVLVEMNHSSIIDDSLLRLKQLGLPLPEVVFQTEELYKATLRRNMEGVVQWLNSRDYRPEATEKTISQIESLLRFDSERSIYNSIIASAFVNIWEQKCSEEQLLRLRFVLCQHFPNEILWYIQLFRGVHSIVHTEELNLVTFENAIELIDQKNSDFSVSIIEYLLQRYENLPNHAEQHDKTALFLLNAADTIKTKDIVPLYLRFMLIDNIIVSTLENLVYDEIEEDNNSIEERESMLSDYKKLIVASVSNELSPQTKNYICSIEDFDNFSVPVAEQLEASNYFFEATMIRLSLDADCDLLSDEVINAIAEKKSWLLNNECFFNLLRSRVIQTSKKAIEEYLFLFTVDCPVITETEFNAAISLLGVDDLFIISIVPPELVTTTEGRFLSLFFSRAWHNNSISFSILQFIAKFEDYAARECFLALDFNRIKYHSFSSLKKEKIKQLFTPILDLDSPSGKVKYMSTTKWLDSMWESELLQVLPNDTQLAEDYIDAVNEACSNSVTRTTVKNLCAIKSIYPMAPHVTDALYRFKQYSNYIVSKTLYDKGFTLETGERGTVLWSEYVKLFKENNYSRTISFMVRNTDFLQRLMDTKEYFDMDETARLYLASIYQDSDSLVDVMEYGVQFALKYFLQMKGFKDEQAATTFVDLVEKNPELLASQELYDYTHEKLVNGVLKGKYTRLRKKLST